MSAFGALRSTIAPALTAIAIVALSYGSAAAQLRADQTALGITSNGRAVTTQIQHGQEKLLISDGKQWQDASSLWLNVKFSQVAPGSRADILSNHGDQWMTYKGGFFTPYA